MKTTSKAAFGTVFWDLTDTLTLTGGVRYTKDTKSYTYYRYNLDGVTTNPFLGALNNKEARFEGSRTDYHVSADYRFNPAVMTYVSSAPVTRPAVTARGRSTPRRRSGSARRS